MSAVIFAGIVVVLAGCQSAPVRLNQDDFLNALNVHHNSTSAYEAADHLSAEQVREDMDFLLYALQKVYGGWEFLRADFRRKVVREIEGVNGEGSASDLERTLDSLAIFTEHKDGHLGLVRPLILKDPESLSHRVVQRYLKRNKFWRMDERVHGGKKVLWLAIYEFPFIEENPEWQEFVAELSRRSARADDLVIDLRINPGGALISALALAKMISSEVPLPDLGDSYHVVTPEAKVGRSYQMGLSGAASPLEDFKSWGAAEKAVTYSIDRPAYQKIEVPRLTFRQDVLVLTSPYCASSCEVLALLLENHPRVLVMGQNTAGIFHFHTPIHLRLPNSGLMIALPTGVLRLKDGRFLELSGLTPSFPVSNLAEMDKFIDQGFRSLEQKRHRTERLSF